MASRIGFIDLCQKASYSPIMLLFIRVFLFVLIVYFVYKRLRSILQSPYAQTGEQKKQDKSEYRGFRQHNRDPYETLGVSRQASQVEIKKAYHDLMAKYHPDKVSHLGEELQSLAKEKSQEIVNAYRELSK